MFCADVSAARLLQSDRIGVCDIVHVNDNQPGGVWLQDAKGREPVAPVTGRRSACLSPGILVPANAFVLLVKVIQFQYSPSISCGMCAPANWLSSISCCCFSARHSSDTRVSGAVTEADVLVLLVITGLLATGLGSSAY